MSRYNKDDLPSSKYYKKLVGPSPAQAQLSSNPKCQKCNEYGHWSYECKNEQKYLYRPSRTKQLANPVPFAPIAPPLEIPTSKKILSSVLQSVKPKPSRKRSRRSPSSSSSSSSGSGSESDSSSNSRHSSASDVSSVSKISTTSNSSSEAAAESSRSNKRSRRRRV
ncbi:Zinc finger CCHC domain-containing protein 10 [Entomophthora muscae]|uniref:Zinc finger CCHC domain-containing protein 10 n=1 Tax=Entomophthora muscae TaxID=34485 RepID=A0ACC2T262_9FUNG|nr:Zinc finger CCHC domain-containing protein 10 [Entomophthora muscae]